MKKNKTISLIPVKKTFIASIFILLSIIIYGAKMESEEEAAYNDAVADCIYRNGNPSYPSSEYNRVEAYCDSIN